MKRTLLGIISSSLLLSMPIAVSAGISTSVASVADAETPRTVLVVDDGQECPAADYSSIQAAVTEAPAGALVRVCPGVYSEFVEINKPLTLLGQPEAVESMDCFDQTPASADVVDPATQAILERPTAAHGNLVTVTTGGVTVAGLVLRGATGPTQPPDSIYDAALHLTSGSAGARIRRNLITNNSLGIDLGSDGDALTRVDHNCLRDNTWGMASQRQDFVGGRVDHNSTFRHTFWAYEVGWSQKSTVESTFDGNVSRADMTTFYVRHSRDVSIVDNDVAPRFRGVDVREGNDTIAITGNRIVGGSGHGVLFLPPPSLPAADSAPLPPSRRALVAGNEIVGFGTTATTGYGIGLAFGSEGAIHGVVIRDNVLRDNNLLGLSVQPNNTGVLASGNHVSGSQYGIWSRPGVSGARYEYNVLQGNTLLDAKDDNWTANVWIGNVCDKDFPDGYICGIS